MPSCESGWNWFAAPPPSAAGDGEERETAAAFARCFAGPDGARVLATLTAMTLGRALGPDASDAALRQLEGQRLLVLTLRALIERGRAAPY